MHPITLRLPVTMLPQPDETTCGPTCLQAVYRYWGGDVALADVIERTHKLQHGGTFAIFLACDALRQGYQATLYTYNLTVFDPTWFAAGVDIAEVKRRLAFGSTAETQGHVKAGRARILANMGTSRVPYYKDIPTLVEQGIEKQLKELAIRDGKLEIEVGP